MNRLKTFTIAIVAAAAAVSAPLALAGDKLSSASVTKGKEIAFRNKGDSGVGNCIACHVIAGADSPGDMGPPLLQIKARFPDRNVLRRRVYDATQFNPISAMPPFGKHRILTEAEIEAVIDFLYTL